MTTAVLTLESQASVTNSGLLADSNLYSGDPDESGAAAAMRFELPEDFDPDGEIVYAVVNLRIRRSSPDSAGQRHALGVFDAPTQSLPTTASLVKSASRHSGSQTIGTGTFSPTLDHDIGTSFETIAVDLTASFQAALAAGHLDGGYVVLLLQPLDFDPGHFVDANGLTQTTPPTIDIEYLDPLPPPDEYLGQLDATLDDWTLTAEGEKRDQIGALEVTLDDWTIDAAGGTSLAGALSATLADWTVQAFGSLAITGQSDITLDDWTTDATGHVGDSRQGALDATLDDWTTDATAVVGTTGRVSATLDSWTIDAIGTVRSKFRHDLYPATLFPDSLFAG